jgi:hypothetical protein
MPPVDPASASQLIARWWCAYDEGDFTTMDALLADGVTFRCRTDTGTTAFEDFVRADLSGRDAVMAWQVQHRMDSPHPLRHQALNFHLTGKVGEKVGFRHYLVVTQVQDLMPTFVPGGVVDGAVVVTSDGSLQIAELTVVIDTMDSVPFRDRGIHQESGS